MRFLKFERIYRLILNFEWVGLLTFYNARLNVMNFDTKLFIFSLSVVTPLIQRKLMVIRGISVCMNQFGKGTNSLTLMNSCSEGIC